MSEDEGDDINFNELVGNLLSSHNANNEEEQRVNTNPNPDHDPLIHDDSLEHAGSENDTGLAEFNVEGDDDALAAVVANAIQNMDEEGVPAEGVFGKESIEATSKDPTDEQQQEEWARILQQGLLQSGDEEAPAHQTAQQPTEQLDQDDENLRRAILESLQELNVDDKEPESTGGRDDTKSKRSSKKSSKKKKDKSKTRDSEKDKNVSSKKKKHSRDHKKSSHQKDSENLLTSEDVIRGFMQHEAGSSEADVNQGADEEDAETHALVEATLKAFERELLGPATTTSSSSQRKQSTNKKSTKVSTSGSSKKKRSSAKKKSEALKASNSNEAGTPSMDLSIESSQEPTKKEKRKKKKKASRATDTSKNDYDDDEFSRALADMVNQVVNTSLTDAGPQVTETPPKLRKEHTSAVPSLEAQAKVGNDQIDPNDQNDDTFDLNQIMQKAMAMAFQEQTKEGIDTSVMEDFNRGLGDFGVPDILTPTAVSPKKKKLERTAPKKHVSKKDKPSRGLAKNLIVDRPVQASGKSKSKKAKPEKPQPSPEELLRKRYSLAAKAAASAARKLITEKNRASKAQLKLERRVAREEKKQIKKVKEEELLAERKELENIVARGPPYPADLRLTKSGKPKKPYRRLTKEEMEKRASMPSEDIKSKKVKKPKKKKLKKLKRIPLSTLRKIPLFNFVKSNIPAAVRQRLNGIDDTLKKIPLQSYKLDINKLAPPERVSKEEMEQYKSSSADESTANRLRKAVLSASFDVARKTVIRREKIPFHPPWDIPSQPPFALPVARRRRKERSRRAKEEIRGLEDKRRPRDSSVVFNARNRIIPAVLFPIINTLKAAAKAKAASGASSEEASRHLMTIIRHTKKSIAQTLASSRRHSRTDYSAIKTESDIQRSQEKEQRLKRIPIFSLANIREIEAKEKNHLQTLQQKKISVPTVIKVEEDENPRREFIDLEILQDSPQSVASTHSTEIRQPEKDANEFLEQKEDSPKVKISEDTIISNSSPGITNNAANADCQTSTKEPTSNIGVVRKVGSTEKDARNNEMEASSIKRELDEELPAVMKAGDNSNGGQKVRNVVEILMKQQLSRNNKDSVDLPSNFENIITATIGELIPSLEEESLRENNGDLSRKRPRKAPPQVLNLDGLVPPSARQLIPKIEEKKLLGTESSVHSKPGKNRKRIEQVTPSYVFNIPDPKETQGKRIMLLKRAKQHLNNEEMNILKKEMNKERKRKWREANVEKNWENDLRARLRRRANGKFGDAESPEKEAWFTDELAKSLADRGTKRENDSALKKATGSTNLGDNEVLNMIATTLNKLDVARMLERELNEEVHKRFDNVTRKPNKTNTELILSPAQPSVTTGSHDTSEGDASKYREERRPSENQVDEFNEDGTLKRPYPDDISVDVPVMKRPRFLTVNENDQ